MAVATEETNSALNEVDADEAGVARVEAAQKGAYVDLPPERRSSLSVLRMADTRFALPDGILKKVDRASMLNSLEVRVPFLDTTVFEYSMGLPSGYTITARKRKRVLKRAFDDVLPPEIRNREKQGFEVPIGEWFKDELASEFIRAVETTDANVIDVDEVKDLHNDHVYGTGDHANFLWAVYVFVQWFETMERRGVIQVE